MSIVRSSDSVTARQLLTLTCSATVQEGIGGTPMLTWTRNGMGLGGEELSCSLVLSFSPIISDTGEYTCTARLAIPEAGVNVSGTNTTSLLVQGILYPVHTLNNYPFVIIHKSWQISSVFVVGKVTPKQRRSMLLSRSMNSTDLDFLSATFIGHT